MMKRNFRKYSSEIGKLAQAYQAKYVEADKILSHAAKSNSKLTQKFSMLFPPPNVTGDLHIGHALTATIQDVLVRYQRSKQIDVIWIPGTDHAGIATQVVVEKLISKKFNKTRFELGRHLFLKEIWKWKHEKLKNIKLDLERLGTSFDWDREYFTMDQVQSKAVTEAFVRLFDDGVIYRSKSLINWSCSLQSTISDIEVENIEINGPTKIIVAGYEKPITFGQMYDIVYRFTDSNEEIIVSTTRPETMLADVAVAVNPNDNRYKKYQNKDYKLWHPFRKCEIPVIFDETVDPNFGTGAVKITPTHDKLDFEIAKRHNLPLDINAIDKKGRIEKGHTDFETLPRFEARDKILSVLSDLSLLTQVRNHSGVLPICSRSKDIIEYIIESQWFVDCSEMSKEALDLVSCGKMKIYPETKSKEWIRWLSDSKDWCISRQLWWGHQIPAYKIDFHKNNETIWIAATSQENLEDKLKKNYEVIDLSTITITRDKDVLDTWFSSALLPFSTLGWPNDTPDFNKYYPIDLMETGHDILFFWVSRMVMLGKKLTGKVPFNKILLHGVLCDSSGRKMSKSLGNVISPAQVIYGCNSNQLELLTEASFKNGILSKEEFNKSTQNHKKIFPTGIPECGADALRFTLCSSNIQNHFIHFDINECYTNKLFFNKIWQASRFYQQSCQKFNFYKFENISKVQNLPKTSQWILSRLSETVEIVNNKIETYNFHLATTGLKNFFYYNFCDVYLETTKPGLNQTENIQLIEDQLNVLGICLSVGLKNLSYFTPFLSEALLKHFRHINSIDFETLKSFRNIEIETEMNKILEIAINVRQLKSQYKITKQMNPKLVINTEYKDILRIIKDYKEVLEILTITNNVSIIENLKEFESYKFLGKSTAGHECSFGIQVDDESKHDVSNSINIRKMEKLDAMLQKLILTMSNEGYQKSASDVVKEKHLEKIQQLKIEINKIKFN